MLFCPWEPAQYLIFSDNALTLFFYSHVPAMVISLLAGLFIYFKNRRNLESKLLLVVTTLFFIWSFFDLVVTSTNDPRSVIFFWSMQIIIEPIVYLFAFLLYDAFIYKKPLSFWKTFGFMLPILPILVLIPTAHGLIGVVVEDCNAVEGFISKYYTYAVELLYVLAILITTFFALRDINYKDRLKEIKLFGLGTVLFLLSFSGGNIIGSFTGNWDLAQVSFIGMPIFVSFLAYLIVRYKTFNVKILSTQVLVWAVVFFVGAQFFFIRNPVNYILNSVTFVMTLIFGSYLIRSVKREIEQKEYLSTLNLELKGLIKQRENLVHLITHKVKGSFTRSKYIFAEMVEGSFGKIDDMMMKMAKKGLDSDNEGIHTVDLVLNSFNLGSGVVKYDMKPMDLKKTVGEVLNEKDSRIKEKGLAVEIMIPDSEYKVNGDVFWIKEVVNNFIENCIRYSIKGTIHIKLEKVDGKVRLAVKDEGVGLSEEDKKGLFTEGGRGKDSLKMNVDSTGYGLFSVKVIVEAHGGRVWAESEGRDKGSTFWIELPAID